MVNNLFIGKDGQFLLTISHVLQHTPIIIVLQLQFVNIAVNLIYAHFLTRTQSLSCNFPIRRWARHWMIIWVVPIVYGMIGLFVNISTYFVFLLYYIYGLFCYFLLFELIRIQGEMQTGYWADGLSSQQLWSWGRLGVNSLWYDLG